MEWIFLINWSFKIRIENFLKFLNFILDDIQKL